MTTLTSALPKVQPERRTWWPFLLALAPVVLALSAGVVALRRSSSASLAGPVPGTVVGASLSSDEASDTGAGNVTVSAQVNRSASTSDQIVFTVALNTHSVDLSAFDPAREISLRAAGKETAGTLVTDPGEQSSHHRSYQLSFPNPGSGQAFLVVRNVAGVPERDLPFTL